MKKSVAPVAGGVTCATYVPPPWSESVELVQLAPKVSSRKSRFVVLVACHIVTDVGVVVEFKVIVVPASVTFQEHCGRAAHSTSAPSKLIAPVTASVFRP